MQQGLSIYCVLLISSLGRSKDKGTPFQLQALRFLGRAFGPPSESELIIPQKLYAVGAQLGHFPLSRENLVESEIDKPAEKVHEGVDGVGGAEMQDARSQDFPAYCAQCREKEGRPQAADNLSA